jgi:hypothetical protein
MQLLARRLAGLFLAAAFICWGCDGPRGTPAASSSMTLAKVKGRVTLRGKPLTKAEIQFNPANVNRKSAPTATAKIGNDGSYEITTLVGANTVTLGGRGIGKNVRLQYLAKTLDVKEGENTFNIPLP